MATASLDPAPHRPVSVPPLAPGAAAMPVAQEAKLSLVGMPRAKLQAELVGIGVPDREARMRVAQIWHWINHRGIRDFGEMTNVGKNLRHALADAFTLERPGSAPEKTPRDGTAKGRN